MNIRRYILLATAILLLVFFSYKTYMYLGKGILIVQPTPGDTITIINQKYYTSEQAREIILSPGKHQLSLVADGYQPYNASINMGWKSEKVLTASLTPKSFEEIVSTTMPNLQNTTYSVAQPKFFLKNTWAAGYILSGANESAIALAILERNNGKWRIVYYDDEPIDRNSTTIPDVVYDYVKAYTGE